MSGAFLISARTAGIAILAGIFAYSVLSSARDRAVRTAGAMAPDEAYLLLGLAPGAKRDEVAAAHRNLMKRLHPDQGGTSYLAARINEAKDVLLQHIKA